MVISGMHFIPSLLLAFALAFAPLPAQDTVTGAFEGTVRDNRTGAPIAGAAVEFINQETGLSVVKLSDSQGRFFQGLLPPGTYTIRATAAGYEPGETVQRLLATRTGEVVPVPINLDPATPAGTATPTPTATPAAPGVPAPAAPPRTAAETDVRGGIVTKDARRGAAFTEAEVTGLPLGSTTLTRTFDELALFLNDVALPPQTLGGGSGPGVGAGVGTSGQFSVNGLRSRANNFTVDGSDNNDEDIGVRRQGFFALVPQPVESVSEFQIVTLLAPAQFGRNLGGQVNAISRSGGRAAHGTLYGIFNASQLNARNPFDSARGAEAAPLLADGRPVIVAPDVRFNFDTLNFEPVGGSPVTVRRGGEGEDSFTLGEGGFVLGGPLRRDRLFYFVSAEGQLLNASQEASFVVPTVAERGAFGTGATGIFLDPLRGTPTFSLPTTEGGDALFSLFPFPNDPRGIYGENTFTQTLPAGARGAIFSAKLDYNFRLAGRPQSAAGRYNFTDDWRDLPVTGGALFSTLRPRVRTQNFSFFLNSEVSGRQSGTLAFNQVRLSYGRTRLNFDEVRDRTFQLQSGLFPDTPFLLNAPLLGNFTLPDIGPGGVGFVPNAGPVIYQASGRTVEDILGPVGQVRIAGFSPIGVDVFNFPQKRVNNTYQFADQFTLRASDHSIIFGTDNRRTELNSVLPRNFRPLITFYGAAGVTAEGELTRDFVTPVDLAAASAATGFFQKLTTGSDAGINLRFYQLNFYAQDEWRVRPNLSLSYGLRYEFNTPAREVNRRIEETFDDPSLGLVPGLEILLAGRARIFDPDLNNLSPRLGVAYAPGWLGGRPGATLIRAGYGHYNDVVLGAVVSQSRNVFPTFLTVNTAGGLGNLLFPAVPLSLLNPSNPALGLVAPGTLNLLDPSTPLAEHVALINLLASAAGVLPGASGVEVTLPARRLKSPGAHHYSVSFERQFGNDLVVSAAYVGTKGHNLIRPTTPNLGTNAVALLDDFRVDLEGNQPFEPKFFGIAVAPGTRLEGETFAGGRPIPGVGGANIYDTTASSRYDALQLQLRGRFGRGLHVRAGYTFSKAVDDVSDVFDLAGAPALPQNSLTFVGERGRANYDAPHRFAYHAVYDLPAFGGRALRLLFSDVQFATAGQFQSGQPFTVNTYLDVNMDGNLTDRLDTTEGIIVTGDRARPLRLTTEDFASLRAPTGRDGRVGRNTFRAGSVLDLNLAVTKTFRLDDGQSIVLRTEVFNFINRANYGVPVRFLESAGFGQATSTVTPGRRVQFQLKYSF
ncbi:MAG TPA: carboxypeptidase regulatory-like domain-containing protein [Pyrinomonadaceae bacterium]|nr:carboxypeptidase regulatory-like domain-containing protein [Pyrinomonadaceae bacterium]